MYKPHGVLASLVTPFDENGSILEENLRKHISWQIDSGVHGIGLGPNTGEFVNLRVDDIKKILDIGLDEARNKVPVTVGALSPSMWLNLEILSYAKEAGASAALVQPPYYLVPTMDGLVNYFKELATIGLPLIIFNHPYKTPFNLTPEFYEKLFTIDNFVGVKEVDQNMARNVARMEHFGDRISYLMGEEFMCFYHYLHGGHGSFPALVNIVPELCVSLFDECKSGNIKRAEKINNDLVTLGEAIYVENYPSGIKEALKMIGRDCGVTRSPLGKVNPESKIKIEKTLEKLGLLKK